MNQTLPYTILNVDDDESGRSAKSRILRQAGYQTVEASTGADGLRLVGEAKPQLVLLDVTLPDMSGPEVCRILKANPLTMEIMVLQISASWVITEDRVSGLEHGADAYLTEPVEAGELIATARALLRLYSREQENRQLVVALRDSEERLRTLSDYVPVFVWACRPNGWCYSHNQRWYEYTGQTEQQALGYGWMSAVHAEDREQSSTSWRQARAQGDVYEVELRYRRADGEYRWFLVRAVPVRSANGLITDWFGTSLDIHDRKSSEQSLAHLAAIVTSSEDAIISFSPDSKIITWNRAAEKLFGWSENEAVGRTAEIYVPPDRLAESAQISQALRRGEAINQLETVRRRRDGSLIDVSLTLSPIEVDNEMIGSSVMVRDITERKRVDQQRKQVEQALIEAKEAADAASRAKSEFLANMSHEIRSPMTGVLGYAEILLGRLTDPEDIECARTIKQSGQYLLQIINDILDLAKIEAQGVGLDKEQIHLPGFLTEIYALMEVNAREKALPLFLKYDGVIPQKIDIDPKRLRQILINLLSNAIKFTDWGSVELVVRFLGAQSELQFEVSDSGIGMTQEQQQNLFHPFTQGDSSVTKAYGGTGLGLAITHRVVGALGGTIAVDSLAGRGSTFRVTIPVQVVSGSSYGRAVAQDNSRIVAGLFTEKMTARVLVCEDQPDIRRLMGYFIKKAGGLVTLIDNGEAAVEVIEQAADDIDLVLLDIQMPRLDGYEVARRVRRSGFRKPIIAVTAAAMPSDRERCLEAGCDDYLAKPIDVEELLAMITRYTAKPATEEASNQLKVSANSLPQAESAPAGDRFNEPNTQRNRRILVVDDRPVALNATMRLLEMDGYTVRTASTGHAAIRVAGEFEPDLVLLDISLPDISGYEVFRRLKATESLAKTVFIALSGHGYEEHIRARHAGFDDFLMKPFDMKEVDKVIAKNLVKVRSEQTE